MLLWVVLVVCILILYYYLVKPHRYWSDRGISQGKPVFLFGDTFSTSFQRQSFADLVQTVYKYGPGKRYSGAYQLLTPLLVIKDPELIKQITVKDFDHFVDHLQFVPDGVDPLWNKNLFALKGQKWREMRSTLSPSFTSSKMKLMYTLILDVAKTFVSNFEKEGSSLVHVELTDTFTRFTNDVIATTAFGVKVDSLAERNNTFYLMGKEASNFSGVLMIVKFIVLSAVPKIAKFFKLTFFSKEVSSFFRSLIKETIATREANGIVRPDMINLLMDARKGIKKLDEKDVMDTGFATVQESYIGKSKEEVTKEPLTDDDIAAQAFIFFLAGFDSVSTLMCFMGYELGVNQEVQDKLRQEIQDTIKEYEGNITYEAIMKMKYFDMVVSESLRKWPASAITDRICTKPYTIDPIESDEKPIHLQPNDAIWIPIYALQRDPKYFPNPDRFDPERFSEENKDKIAPYTFLPFGTGPRNCIGSRFAILETKLVYFELLSKFKIVPTDKSVIPLNLSKKTFNMTAEGGFNFGLKRL